MKRFFETLSRLLDAMIHDPRVFLERLFEMLPSFCSAYRFSRGYKESARHETHTAPLSPNPLWDYFQGHREGHGIWKWEHYFDIYHRHFSRFIGQKVNVMEIGVFSGGSLEMWRSCFGEKSHIYGVDIEPACKEYENDHVSVFIGDQTDGMFWSAFRKSAEGIDILIDDGGHTPEQQQITLEEMLPHLRPGGVFMCEDIHGISNRFAAFAIGLVSELNHMNLAAGPLFQSGVSQFQSTIHSIHFYPYVLVSRNITCRSHDCPHPGTGQNGSRSSEGEAGRTAPPTGKLQDRAARPFLCNDPKIMSRTSFCLASFLFRTARQLPIGKHACRWSASRPERITTRFLLTPLSFA